MVKQVFGWIAVAVVILILVVVAGRLHVYSWLAERLEPPDGKITITIGEAELLALLPGAENVSDELKALIAKIKQRSEKEEGDILDFFRGKTGDGNSE